jgi:hypothetical protein
VARSNASTTGQIVSSSLNPSRARVMEAGQHVDPAGAADHAGRPAQWHPERAVDHRPGTGVVAEQQRDVLLRAGPAEVAAHVHGHRLDEKHPRKRHRIPRPGCR